MARRRRRRTSRSRARRRRRSTVAVRVANPPRRRGRRRRSVSRARRRGGRRNPPRFSVRGIVGQLQDGAIDAGWIVAGKATSRTIAGFIPAPGGQIGALAVQALAAILAGYVGGFVSPNARKMMLAGGLAGVVESFVKSANIPFVSDKLSDFYTPGPLAVGSYPGALPAAGVSAYPEAMGDVSDDAAYSM